MSNLPKALITRYCTSNPAALTNSQAVGNFSQTLGSVVALICAYGYVQPTSNGSATCISRSNDIGRWNIEVSASFDCNSALFTLINLFFTWILLKNEENNLNKFINNLSDLITAYCDATPTEVLPNSLLVGTNSFIQTLKSQATIMCAFGYVQPTSNGVVNCSAYNASSGIWSLITNTSCNST